MDKEKMMQSAIFFNLTNIFKYSMTTVLKAIYENYDFVLF